MDTFIKSSGFLASRAWPCSLAGLILIDTCKCNVNNNVFVIPGKFAT